MYLFICLVENRLYSSVYSTAWKKYFTVNINKGLKWPPSAWMYILTRSNVESVTLRRTMTSVTRLAASKIC